MVSVIWGLRDKAVPIGHSDRPDRGCVQTAHLCKTVMPPLKVPIRACPRPATLDEARQHEAADASTRPTLFAHRRRGVRRDRDVTGLFHVLRRIVGGSTRIPAEF